LNRANQGTSSVPCSGVLNLWYCEKLPYGGFQNSGSLVSVMYMHSWMENPSSGLHLLHGLSIKSNPGTTNFFNLYIIIWKQTLRHRRTRDSVICLLQMAGRNSRKTDPPMTPFSSSHIEMTRLGKPSIRTRGCFQTNYVLGELSWNNFCWSKTRGGLGEVLHFLWDSVAQKHMKIEKDVGKTELEKETDR